MANVVQVAWARYLRQLEREPLKTKAITSGSLAALSDITAQKLVSNAPLNWRRTIAMALFGLIWSGPSNHYWQKFTNQLFKGKKDAASVVQKVLIDNLVYSPVFNLLVMAYIATVVEGRSMSFVQTKLQRDFPSLQLDSWKLWPLVSLINYKYVPLKLRVLVMQAIAFFWQTFLILRAKSTVVQRVPLKTA
ncbi:hypothetical protein WJX82_004659 [Trebouxia sp. C0006]